MKIIFITNALTPHQLPFSICLANQTDVEFLLIESKFIDRSILPEGWKQNGGFDFVVSYDSFISNHNFYMEQIIDCDILIYGSTSEKYVIDRLRKNKLTFRYAERVYKQKCPWWQIPLRAVKYYWQFGRFKNLYLLCASAYTAADYAKTGTFINKAYKWGYFPETKKYESIDNLISNKSSNSILWAGRLIDWKHPEVAIEVARRLKVDGFDFNLGIIGFGDMEGILKELILKYGLEKYVSLLGPMFPQDVRAYMEKSQIYLFTSDRGEGWGAVLNEAMNSGCAVVASHAIGSAPFLLNDGENGYIYQDGDIEDIYTKVKELLVNNEKRQQFGKLAYETIINEWNAKTAVERLLNLAKEFNCSGKLSNDYTQGPCSKAEILKDNWYKKC